MQIDALHVLEDRWPGDTLIVDDPTHAASFVKLFSSDKNTNIYDDLLQLDQSDSNSIRAFASANSWSYQPRAVLAEEFPSGTERAWPGHVAPSTAPMLAHRIQGSVYGYEAAMYVAYAPSSTQNESDPAVALVKRSVIKVTLPMTFPQIVLESNKNDKTAVSTMPSTFLPSQRLQLEGNFNQYFDLYAPTGLHINTLTVLAPNFMETLMHAAASFDVEFFGNQMILITKDPLYTPTVMKQALLALETQLAYLTRLSGSWDYQPVNQPFDVLQKPFFKGETVKIGPFRLSPGILISIILAGFAAAIVLSTIFGE